MKKLIFSNLAYYAFILLFMSIYCGGSYFVDFYWRPWAYSRDKNAKLFVGKWAGQFQDPDGVSKEMTKCLELWRQNERKIPKKF
jgi:hypothetical protein